GRVDDQLWTTGSTVKDDFQYSYDRDSNATAKINALNSNFNESYGYDGLNRLTNFARGSHTQSFNLDAQGNFSSITTDSVTQTRSYNQQNQITGISGATTPTYDNNGNLTIDETGRTLKFDAWNRLVQVKNSGGAVIQTYSYDALGRRITE